MLNKKLLVPLLLAVSLLTIFFIKSSPFSTRAISQNDMSALKSYIVTFKDSATDSDVSVIKKKISELGGAITTEYTLIKGFAAKLPAIHTSTIQDHEHVLNVEEDKEVKIQN